MVDLLNTDKSELEDTIKELKKVKAENNITIQEKDELISELESKIVE